MGIIKNMMTWQLLVASIFIVVFANCHNDNESTMTHCLFLFKPIQLVLVGT